MPKKQKKKNASNGADVSANKKSGRDARTTFVIAILGVVVVFFSYRLLRTPSVDPGKFRGHNVLLITLDTLRADRLPLYGYDKVKTPALDQLAKSSLIFEKAYSHVPMTLPSHASILSGRLTIGHGIRDNTGFFLDESITTLPEILKKNGYATSAFVSSFVLDSRWKLDQGFDLYFDNFGVSEFENLNPRDVQRIGEETEMEVEHWLDEHRDQTFFSWVHLYDPHDPYEPPEPYRSQYASNPYDGEIAYTDDVVGRLMKKLDELKLIEETIVIVTSDHGEGLGDHNELQHAMFLYDTTQHVPLLIHLPEGKEKRISGVVSHIDLVPTILDWLGIEQLAEVQGKSLIPLIQGKEKAERIAFSESQYAELHYGWGPLKSVASNRYKYIDAPKPELYDMAADPKELRNVIQEKPYIAKAMQEQLQQLFTRYSDQKFLTGPQKMDPDTEERLRALGYIGHTVTSTEESRKIDPKDKIHLTEALHRAFVAITGKQNEVGLEILRPVLEEDPNMVDAHFFAGVAYGNLGEYDKAIDELMKTLSFRPDYSNALYNLGWVNQRRGNYQEAEVWFQKVLQYEKNHLMASIALARLYRSLDQPEKAAPYSMQAAKWYVNAIANTRGAEARSTLHATLGELYFSVGEVDLAEENLSKAAELTPEKPDVHYNLAQVYEARKQPLKALEAYRKEMEADPENFKAFMNAGILYQDLQQYDSAALAFQRVLQLRPDDPHASYLLAKSYALQDRNLNEAVRLAEHAIKVEPGLTKAHALLALLYRRLGRS